FRTELLSKILGLNGHMIVQVVDSAFEDFADVSERMQAIEGVGVAMPLVEGQVLASTNVAATGALVRGVRGQDLDLLTSISGNITVGSIENFDSSGGVIVGARLARTLGLLVGEDITLLSPRGASTPFGITPRIKSYRVDALFEVGMSEYDSSIIFMPLSDSQLFFNKGKSVNALELMVDDPDRMDYYRAEVERAAQRAIFMVDWRQRNQTFFSALEVERNVMFLILTMIVLVAALNIVSGLIMLVKDKGQDIAILRTMGATRGAIMRVFFVTGASIGLIGTLAGFCLGVVVCWNIETIQQFLSTLTGTDLFSSELYFLSHLPAEMDTGEVTQVVLLSLGLSFIATLIPAWRAARLDPVEALRYE
ncbi:MAG: lipoprotein-releasing ABC transporter permease subunit, partial [Fimbriimonadaceae bacterium]|nr:lipoprotein-releasing ABC transporter permease subunit [Alphaproteobacteria bacterium]